MAKLLSPKGDLDFKLKDRNKEMTEQDWDQVNSVMTRILIAQSKMQETNIGDGLRNWEKIIVECKAEMRGLDQELIMTKIEMALLKC